MKKSEIIELVIISILILLFAVVFIKYGGRPVEEMPVWAWWLLK